MFYNYIFPIKSVDTVTNFPLQNEKLMIWADHYGKSEMWQPCHSNNLGQVRGVVCLVHFAHVVIR